MEGERLMKVAIVLAITIAFLGVLAAIVFLVVDGKDTAPLMVYVGGAATTLVPQLFTLLKAHSVENAVSSMQDDVAEVKDRTNGPLTQMGVKVDDIYNRVCRLEDQKGDSS
jgi:hypothetical protein